MPDGQGRTFEVCPIPRLEQLFANLCDQWQAKNLEAEAHLRLDEVAGAHAAGQVPQESRARQSADPEGNPQYFIRVFGAGIHYAVDESRHCLWVTRLDMPKWES